MSDPEYVFFPARGVSRPTLQSSLGGMDQPHLNESDSFGKFAS